MIKNINNIFSIFLMLTFIGYTYATCFAEMNGAGLVDGYNQDIDKDVVKKKVEEYNTSLPEAFENWFYLETYISTYNGRVQPNFVMLYD
ncbi:uncharacterized protein LOC100302492 isoform X1 [Acyrthosiphon pisum]|uniref:Uncharacterized protein n=1 Tax=Acyrthosiphon pisum TaxID=7029 RepID=A0A8R2FCG6_ACYPI|nr:uncharacterized protein LOC100302492 isoform X1 [Acyrthosiphon pisum]|eukprot:XP_008188317.1 PREDICTED: uncharacterized protein LOC100302492 isoform X1 [Acyrthosiphon pisum]